jgi:hypothetical protein
MLEAEPAAFEQQELKKMVQCALAHCTIFMIVSPAE